MDFQKTIEGHVVQIFHDGECVGQRFYAGVSCRYEYADDDGLPIDQPLYRYQPYDMVQPE